MYVFVKYQCFNVNSTVLSSFSDIYISFDSLHFNSINVAISAFLFHLIMCKFDL